MAAFPRSTRKDDIVGFRDDGIANASFAVIEDNENPAATTAIAARLYDSGVIRVLQERNREGRCT